ncbi:MAG: hypothetical protein CM15mP82_0770 [Methanobacteriota archaeon]|nr:MAG: hypothetical protein CM15mP82_0770 [Euryarchaeota archaeon]
MASKSFTYDLIKSIDHDPQAFTQGLEIDEGIMYESTGLYGHSQLREISTTDGSLIRSVDLPSTVFGEGLTVTGQTVLVLTWKSGIIFEFEKDNFTQVGEHSLEGKDGVSAPLTTVYSYPMALTYFPSGTRKRWIPLGVLSWEKRTKSGI